MRVAICSPYGPASGSSGLAVAAHRGDQPAPLVVEQADQAQAGQLRAFGDAHGHVLVQAEALLRSGRRARAWDLLLRPPAHLFKALVLKRGLLDGWRGLAVAWLGAAHVQLKWLRLHEAEGEGIPPR